MTRFWTAAVMMWVATEATAQSRPTWSLDWSTSMLSLHGAGGQTIGQELLPGLPRQVRADCASRAVIVDDFVPRLWLADTTSVVAIDLPYPVRGAVPDGRGGAFALLSDLGGYRVVRCDRNARLSILWQGVEVGVRIAMLAPDRLAISYLVGATNGLVRVYDLTTGVVVASTATARPVLDLIPDGRGGVLFVGSDWDRFRMVDEDLMTSCEFLATPPHFAAAPLAEGAWLFCTGWPPRFEIHHPSAPSFVAFVAYGGGALEPRLDGTVFAHFPGMGLARRVDARRGFVELVPWPATVSRSDGSGLLFARALDPIDDEDGDGEVNQLELFLGSDPGNSAETSVAWVRRSPWALLQVPGRSGLHCAGSWGGPAGLAGRQTVFEGELDGSGTLILGVPRVGPSELTFFGSIALQTHAGVEFVPLPPLEITP